MTPRSRTMTGVATMLVLLPIFAGLLACMPETAPIGNPERARIDPDLNGVWIYAEDEEVPFVFYFEPYDKRTWLLYGVELRSDNELLVPERSLATYDGLIAGLDVHTEDEVNVVRADELSVHKAWVAKVGREQFLVWQIMGALRDEGDWGVNFAYNWRMTRPDPDQLSLQFMNTGHESFEDVDHMDRKAVERVIKRHSDEEGFFDEELIVLNRAKVEDASSFAELLKDAIGSLD